MEARAKLIRRHVVFGGGMQNNDHISSLKRYVVIVLSAKLRCYLTFICTTFGFCRLSLLCLPSCFFVDEELFSFPCLILFGLSLIDV